MAFGAGTSLSSGTSSTMDMLHVQRARAHLLQVIHSRQTWLGSSWCILITRLWIYTMPHNVLDYVAWVPGNTSCPCSDMPLLLDLSLSFQATPFAMNPKERPTRLQYPGLSWIAAMHDVCKSRDWMAMPSAGQSAIPDHCHVFKGHIWQ